MINKLYGEKSRNIFIGNFSCEEVWDMGNAVKIPVVDLREVKSVINNLDELIIYLANSKDIVILRKRPDKEFIKKLKELGIEIPVIETPQMDDTRKSVSELVLCDEQLLFMLKDFVIQNLSENRKTNLIPYGVTQYEEKLADFISARIMLNTSICSRLNSKVLLNIFVNQLNMAFPESAICNGIFDLKSKGRIFLQKYNCIVVKEVYSSGGSGLAIIDTVEKLDSMCKYIEGSASARGSIVLEKWYDSMTSYNHQYVITDDGVIPYCFSKQVFGHKNGKITGSVFFNIKRGIEELWKKHYDMSYLLLKEIEKQGYRGIVGFDSIVDQQGHVLFPAVDMNCRINLSTIFWEILTTYFNSGYSLFICKEYVLSYPVEFCQIQSLLGNNGYCREKKEGIVILNFTSLNYNILNANSKYGRIFFGVFAKTEKKLRELWSFIASGAMDI